MILLHLTETKCLAASKYIYEKCDSTLTWAVYREREELGPKDENDELRSWRFLFVFDEEGWKDVQSSHVTEKTRYLGFLAEAFQPRAFWFIIFENVRRLLLSSALIIFATGPNDTGTAPQAIAALLICVFSIKVYHYCKLLLSLLYPPHLSFIDIMKMRRPTALPCSYISCAADSPFAKRTDSYYSELTQWVSSTSCKEVPIGEKMKIHIF